MTPALFSLFFADKVLLILDPRCRARLPEEAVSGVLAEVKRFVDLVRHGQYLVECGLFDAGAPEAVRDYGFAWKVVELKMSGMVFGTVLHALQAVSENDRISQLSAGDPLEVAIRFFRGMREFSTKRLQRDRIFERVAVLC